MSNNESFIDEVTEEVRRDQLFAYFRKYGWIAGLVVAGIVGGAAWTEYQKASREAAAQAKGDAVLAAMEVNEPEGRAAALAALEPHVVSALLEAASFVDLGERDKAREAFAAVAGDDSAPQIYRDVAGFKMVLLDADGLAPADLELALGLYLNPGHPYRLLAQEQVALAYVKAGDIETARGKFQAILEDAEVARGLSQRVEGAMVALGAAETASN